MKYIWLAMNTGMVGVDEVHMAGREDMDEINANEQFQNYQTTMSKSPQVRVKTKATHKVTPSKKTTSTSGVPYCEQPSAHPTTSRRGTNDYIIIVLCMIFDYFKLKMVSGTFVPRTPSKRRTSTASKHESEHPTTNWESTLNYIILVLCIIFFYFNGTLVS